MCDMLSQIIRAAANSMVWQVKVTFVIIIAGFLVGSATYFSQRNSLLKPTTSRDSPCECQTIFFQKKRGDSQVGITNSTAAETEGVGRSLLQDFTKLPAVKRLTGSHVAWDNPELIELIREQLIDLPRPTLSKMSYPLFETPQATAVDKILKHKKRGFFVECGALDGERSSNTIWLEFERNWTGLLVEMDPSYYLQIRGKNRRVYSSNVCLSPEKYPLTVNFKEDLRGAGRVDDKSSKGSDILPTLCLPLYSIMLALNRTKIDYFSLDIEGFELAILRTIPFDKLDISIITAESKHLAKWGRHTDDKLEDTVKFMASKGYDLHSTVEAYVPEIYFGARDNVFVKRGLRL